MKNTLVALMILREKTRTKEKSAFASLCLEVLIPGNLSVFCFVKGP